MRSINLNGKLVGDGNPCYFIGEIGGLFKNFDEAKRLIDSSIQIGINAIKFQTLEAETVTTKNNFFQMKNTGKISQYELLKDFEIPKNVQMEFHEETGHILDPKRIFLDKDNYKKYYITAYYKCNYTEFGKFDKLINNNEKFKEMDKLCWISFNKSINIMIKYNKNIIQNIPKFSLEYTNEFKKRKWFLSIEINELIWAIRNKHNLNKKIKNQIIVENYIHNNLKNKKFFDKVKKIIEKYIYKISKYDWFEESLYKFKYFQYNQNNKKKSKSPPKKKISENKKKYIPPHLR